ncbi:hypothetical protein AB0O91_40145 [Kitasatospora sp. NPDC089797]|uniref:hypothetical protein n=1 Tax=Kitasatospora sp. NPDC089797 TaxID=3155298 RepID=UPI0034371DFB
MDETSDRHVSARYERLAQRVRDALAAAGLPLVPPGLDQDLAAGAEVRVSTWNRHFGTADLDVLVSWHVSPRLRGRATEDARDAAGAGTPALRQSDEARRAMADAMIAILASAGFTARDHGNAYEPFDVQVLAGPERRSTPARTGAEPVPAGQEPLPARTDDEPAQ